MAKKQPQEAAATARFPLVRKSADIVDQTGKIAEFVKANPQYATQPTVQQAVGVWQGAADKVLKNDQAIKAARVSLLALLAGRHASGAEWARATKSLLA